MLTYVEAHARCEARARLSVCPPVAPNDSASAKLDWRDKATLGKLAEAYARAKDHEAAGRLLGG